MPLFLAFAKSRFSYDVLIQICSSVMFLIVEPQLDKTNKMIRIPSEDSDVPSLKDMIES